MISVQNMDIDELISTCRKEVKELNIARKNLKRVCDKMIFKQNQNRDGTKHEIIPKIDRNKKE